MITDLSFPEGLSVNGWVDFALCSLKYTSVNRVAEVKADLGVGTLMPKIHIKSVYRMILVHLADRPLLGWKWEGQVFVDSALRFGLCSAPKILTAVADVIEWCFWQAGVWYVDHYLDDYIVLVACGTTECALSLEIVMSVANDLRVPLAEDKCEGPTISLHFLEFEIDSSKWLLRLHQEKVDRLQEMLLGWFENRWCWHLDLGVAHREAAGHR
uniref:Reverse transcriptase domain-containing protein n=1 Tax=Amphimedon queenslandica TaxID=400682 RepID=A0A1X7TTG3_AMPQE